MTTASEATSGTALAQVAPGALALARGARPFTVTALVNLIGQYQAPAAPVPAKDQVVPFPAVAPVIAMTAALTTALARMPEQFGKLQIEERRILTAAEIKQLTDETVTLNLVSDQIGKRKDAIALAIRHHVDCQAEADGNAYPAPVTRSGKLLHEATPRIGAGKAAGHYSFATPGKPVEVPVEGYEDSWQIRYTSGKSEPSVNALIFLEKKDKVTHDEMLSFTRQVRVLDEVKIAAFIRANPERALEILAAITMTEQAGASTVSPKK